MVTQGRRVVLAIALAVVMAACGDSSPPLAETSTDRLRLDVVTDPDPLVTGQPATFDLVVTNDSQQPALLTFDTTQRGDLGVSTGDVEVYRWAERRAFAQEPYRVEFEPGQTATFALDVEPLPLAPGEYEMLATVTGLPKLRTVRTAVTVVADEATERASQGAP